MKKSLLMVCLTALISFNANAELNPHSRGADDRVRQVQYHDNEVFLINAKAGVATNIVLESDEVYLTHAFGDSEAWEFETYGNNVFIKPKVEHGSTNLVLVTNKRTYNFFVKYGNKAVYQIKFNYPDTQAKLQAKNQRSNLLDEAYKGRTFNLAYEMKVPKGSTNIQPLNVWDDGTFTYFKFAGNVDLPAIYAVLQEDGKEVIVNRTVTGQSNNIIVMHKVNPKWKLRLGAAVIEIYNNGMNWVGIENKSGTVSPFVQRELVGGNENE